MREFKSPVPKFKVGDKVSMKTKTLYGETEGVITHVERTYQRCDEHGNPEPRGLNSLESMFYIPKDKTLHDKPWQSHGNKDITYEFAGPNMIIGRWHNGGSGFGGNKVFYNVCTKISYTIKTPQMNSIYPERSLKLKTS
jgi:hypothetical protein